MFKVSPLLLGTVMLQSCCPSLGAVLGGFWKHGWWGWEEEGWADTLFWHHGLPRGHGALELEPGSLPPCFPWIPLGVTTSQSIVSTKCQLRPKRGTERLQGCEGASSQGLHPPTPSPSPPAKAPPPGSPLTFHSLCFRKSQPIPCLPSRADNTEMALSGFPAL